MTTPLYAQVALELSISKSLDYLIPEALVGQITKGAVVEVPLRGSLRRGYVVEIKKATEAKTPLAINRLLSKEPPLTTELFQLAFWIARYYLCPLGRVLKTMLPAGVRKDTKMKTQHFIMRAVTLEEMRANYEKLQGKAPQQAKILEVMLQTKKGILQSKLLEETKSAPSALKSLIQKGILKLDIIRADSAFLANQEYFKVEPKQLREEQMTALQNILFSLHGGLFQPHLLFGVTGSGKTEVYLQAMEEALKVGKGVIMLVPEIALTEQTIERIRCRLKTALGVLHYRISNGEKGEIWEKIRKGEIRVVIGARSALFCPMSNLGLIIVDEEHEPSYKQQDDSPAYHARDLAVVRGKLNNATVVLGSATPSLESYHNAITNKYRLSKLSDRGEQASLPQVTIVDMRREHEKAKCITYFSDLLLTKIEERKKRGEQSILFLNRRGFHTQLLCQACGKSVMCPHCDTKLTFHKNMNLVMCHLCGKEDRPPRACPDCRMEAMIKYQGVGTEKIEAMLQAIFPKLHLLRIDADTTRHKGSLQIKLQEFRSGKADVLIGTQMVAKGLHFPDVTLVGVLNADATLNIPDFRSQERVFQLITQVAGRAGRGVCPGEVIIQTCLPEHSTIAHAASQNYEAFFAEEIATRQAFDFPPFTHIVKFTFSGKEERRVVEGASEYHQALQAQLPKNYVCHPVIPGAHLKVKDAFRYQFLVRGPAVNTIRHAIEQIEAKFSRSSSVARFIDVDPTSTL